MNARLLQLLRKVINDPGNVGLDDDIWALRPTESDFDDELLGSFTGRGRGVIYIGMDMWCANGPSEEFLNRRLAIENDEMCRKLLESRLARRACTRSQGKRSSEEPVHYEQRTPEFQRKLKDLVLQHLRNPNDWTAFQRITSLKPTDEDFDDMLFDSLTAEGRLEVYSMLLLWCGYTSQKAVLERRALVETDPACSVAISAMLSPVQ